MQVVYVVSPEGRGWSVRRGVTTPMHFESADRAISSAENLARAAASAGDVAVVNVREQGHVREHCRINPDRLQVRELAPRSNAGPHLRQPLR